jgi:hypothetical protein
MWKDADRHDCSTRLSAGPQRGTLGYLALAAFCLALLAGYATHVAAALWQGHYGLLLGGILFFPLGVANGWLTWLDWL